MPIGTSLVPMGISTVEFNTERTNLNADLIRTEFNTERTNLNAIQR